MENEIWRPVVGYEGWYEVSSFGNLRSVDRAGVDVFGVARRYKGRMISSDSLSYGYPVAILMKNGKRKTVRIHRIVAEAFIPNPDNKPFIDHIDTNRRNARVENLRWVDRAENANNPNSIKNYSRSATKEFGSGWKTINTRNANKSCHSEVPVCQYSLDGIFIRRYRSIAEAGEVTGIAKGNIDRAHKGVFKQAGGFLWAKEGEQPIPYVPNTPTRQHRVFQYDINGVFIKEWVSVAEAERSLMATNVSRSAREGKYPAGGYWWSYTKKDNYFDE